MECTQNTFQPATSFAALTDNLITQILSERNSLSDQLIEALTIADRVDKEQFIYDIAILTRLRQFLDEWADMLCTFLGCEDGLPSSIMNQVLEALDMAALFLRNDFTAVRDEIFHPYERAKGQTSVVKERYELYKNRFKQGALFMLESVAIDGRNYSEVYATDEFDVHLSSRQYFKAFHRYQDITLHLQNIATPGRGNWRSTTEAVDLPVTLYNSSQQREISLLQINSSLSLLRNITEYLSSDNELFGTPFQYQELDQVTGLGDECFGSYFVLASEVIKNMQDRNVAMYNDIFANLSNKFFSDSVRELLLPIIQLRKDLEEYYRRYMENELTKLEVISQTILSVGWTLA